MNASDYKPELCEHCGQTIEIWAEIVNYEGLYAVSNMGRVRSRARAGTILILSPDIVVGKGYMQVTLQRKGARERFKVHRLVASAFIENPEGKPEVNHKDGDKWNNAAQNLEWATRKENNRHALDTGLLIPRSGMKNHNTKLKDSDAEEIRSLFLSGLSQRDIGKKYGVGQTAISEVVNFKKRWKN